MTKKSARQQYSAARQALTLPMTHQLLALMIQQFERLILPPVRHILSYKPMAERNEIPIYLFETLIEEQQPSAIICYPGTDFARGTMEAYENNDDLQWETTPQGFEQPFAGPRIDPGQIDLVLVPLLAFDKTGNRVGYGKGFYDRYLCRCKPDVITIGCSYFDALPKLDDINKWDVPLKYCITPHQLYEF